MTIVIVVVMVLVIAFWAVSSLSRSALKAKGRAKCVYCGKRLKKITAGYADHCSHCQLAQPWAAKA